jgi:hypothetical protein
MPVRKSTRAAHVVALCGIIVGMAACADTLTGVRDEAPSERVHSLSDTSPEQVCYLIDGQRYCVGTAPAESDSTNALP